MSLAPPRNTWLHRLYHRYLENENAADFVRGVCEQYLPATLKRLAVSPDRATRRAAVLALSFCGDMRSNAVLGRALHDEDRGVRMLAESGVGEIWLRDGTPPQQLLLRKIVRLNGSDQASEAVRLATQLLDAAPRVAEAWNQRAVARFQMCDYVRSARDCRQTLKLNRFHYKAAIGMAHCQLEFSDPVGALTSLRKAVALFPDLEAVRAQIRFLSRALEELGG